MPLCETMQRPPRIVVIGDLMVDEWKRTDFVLDGALEGACTLRVDGLERFPGGAANVARHLAGLGAAVSLIGVVGRDSAGEHLRECLGRQSVDVSGIVSAYDRPTTVKTRLVAKSGETLLRFDKESTADVADTVEHLLCSALIQQISLAQACVLSDYSKGVLTSSVVQAACELCEKHATPIIADPKGPNLHRYEHVSVLVPNESEAQRAWRVMTGQPASAPTPTPEVGAELSRLMPRTTLAVTCGANGIRLFRSGTELGPVPGLTAPTSSASSAVGAGDAATAGISFALALGADIRAAVELGNAAGAISASGRAGRILRLGEIVRLLAGRNTHGFLPLSLRTLLNADEAAP